MRTILTLSLLAVVQWATAQVCPTQPADIPVSNWTQEFNADWFADSDYLDGLNQPELGTGVSDSNLAIASNSGIEAFIGVKRRATIAPADNVPFVDGKYQVPTGYSPTSPTNPTPTSLTTWNFLVYVDLGAATFADVDVRLYLDFNPCFSNESSEMFELSFSDLMSLSNLDPSEISQLATNQNLASNAWAVFDDANVAAVDPTAAGYYTIALAVYDDCGNRRLWHEVLVAAGDAFTPDSNGNGIADAADVAGCTLVSACNFDCNATVSDGSCDFLSCSGCTIVEACNYNADATITDSNSCLFPIDVFGTDQVDCNGDCLNDSDGDGVCDASEVVGCQDSNACNYNAAATDSGACSYPAEFLDCDGVCLADEDGDGVCDEQEVDGCTDPVACNFNDNATDNDGSCEYTTCAGCTIENACNYNALATISQPSICEFAADGFDCEGACLNDADGDGVCDFQEILGCTDAAACNYSSSATDDSGNCSFALPNRDCNGDCENDENGNGLCDEEEVVGCTDALACNYDPSATFDSGCDTASCVGCTEPSACNYDETATQPDYAACAFPVLYYDCDGQPVLDANENGTPDQLEVAGCTDPSATNYAPNATIDDDSCILSAVGCMLPWAPNYDPAATLQGLPVLEVCFVVGMVGMPGPGTALTGCSDFAACNYAPGGDPSLPCDYSCFGCTNEAACDFNADAVYNTGCSDFTSCYGCTDAAADNYDVTATLDDGSCTISGCTTAIACNYNEDATVDNGLCEFTSCAGCTNATACNYDSSATLSDGSCVFATGVCDVCEEGVVVDNDADNDGVCDADEIAGCVTPGACNYNSAATNSDGSCVFATGCDYCSGETDGTGSVVDGDADNNQVCDALEVLGCLNESACNYNALATQSDGSCEFESCVGCMNPSACNYDAEATLSEPISCVFAETGYNCDGICLSDSDSDGVCDAFEVSGCDDSTACNYNADATDNDGSCTYPEMHYDCNGDCLVDEDNDGVCDPLEVLGCVNPGACNFNENATESNGSCEFTSCAACGDETACNYEADAIVSDLTLCTYPPTGYDDCAGTICTDVDDDGTCDFDEVPTCIGEFDAPVITLQGLVDLSTDPATWGDEAYEVTVADANEVSLTYADFEGRLADGVYSVTRIYEATDVCGNSTEAGQLLRATGQLEGCTFDVATNYNPDAINDDGTCSFEPSCPGDLTQDGIVGASDLLILLSGFGIPCE